jgi:hypothetical protein
MLLMDAFGAQGINPSRKKKRPSFSIKIKTGSKIPQSMGKTG